MVENTVLRQHFEYYIDMQKEKETLETQFDALKKAENNLMGKFTEDQAEINMLENKAEGLERNATLVFPERLRDISDKVESLNGVLS